MRQLDCEEAAKRLHTFLDRELDEAEIAEVHEHLSNCQECHARFRFEASVKKLIMTRSAEQTVPPGLRERLSERLRQQKS